MDNKALWDRVCITDPAAVKPITGKQYSGNSPKPYWIVERLTDEFGPCGIGWGVKVMNERMERLSETDTLHVALVQFWFMLEGQRGEIEQMGQTKATYLTSKDKLMVDEDAPKKSVTDALVKCASYLGFAGDIFSGRWDDSKYVAEARGHYDELDRLAARKKWLDERFAAINASKTTGELKRIVEEAVSVAASEDDKEAVEMIKAAGMTKAQTAKPKEHA